MKRPMRWNSNQRTIGDFVEHEHIQIRGILKRNTLEWEASDPTKPVLDIIKFGYMLPNDNLSCADSTSEQQVSFGQ